MAARQVTTKSALIEARWVIKILLGIICGLVVAFLMIGLISETNETSRMKACVEKSNREWTHQECVLPSQPVPQPSSS